MAHHILDLDVKDNKVEFTSFSSDLEGKRQPLNKGREEDLDLSPLREETINLLVKLQRLLADVLRGEHQLAEVDEALEQLTRVLGQNLYEVLFKGEKVRAALNDALKGDKMDLLRVELEFEGVKAPLLASWPWEYLYNPVTDPDNPKPGQFLAVIARLVLNRNLSFRIDENWTLLTSRPVKLLLVCAAPSDKDLRPPKADSVIEKIKDLQQAGVILLEELTAPFQVTNDPQPNIATWDNFKRMVQRPKLEERPHIIHFIGHGKSKGGKGSLAFLDSDGKADWIDEDEFAKLVAEGAKPKLVFLQACESALPDPHAPVSGVAQKLARQDIPAIVAMQAKIENQAANAFALTFYEELATGKPVDCAVQKARQAILDHLGKKKRALAFGLPVLYLRTYQGLIGPELAAVKQPALADKKKPLCPRCHTELQRDDQEFCTECGLGFWCTYEEKGLHRLDDPLGKICGKCRTRIEQPPYAPESSEAARGPQTPADNRPAPAATGGLLNARI